MPSRLQIGTFLILAVVTWAGVLTLRGTALSWDFLWPFGLVLSILTLVLLAWDRAVWRFPPLHGWFVHRPDLRDTWKARLISHWKDPETDRAREPIDCFVAVTQTSSALQLRLMTEESESWLVASEIRRSPKGSGYQVLGVYMNQPEARLRGVRSEMHFGGLVLDTHGSTQKPESLTGEYWTDRGTKGSIQLSGRVKELHTRYHAAAIAMAPPG